MNITDKTKNAALGLVFSQAMDYLERTPRPTSPS